MPFMTRIPSDLRRFGLTVELVPGWETRGSAAFAPAGVTCHWTAGPKNAADKARPSLNVCTNGRPGIPGPLCNIYLARDGTCVVVAAGRANHAGTGGFRGLVGNSAVYGIEAECAGDNDWSKAQRKAYPVLVAALLSGLGRDASWAHGHHEWAPTRKIDIRDIMPTVRAEAAAVLARGGAVVDNPEELDMDAALLTKIVHETVVDVLNKRGVTDAGNYARESRDLLAQLLAKGPGVDIDPADIAAAIPEGIAQQVADLLAQRLAG